MHTQQPQAVHAAPPVIPGTSHWANIRTLVEGAAAMYIVLMLTGYAILKIFQSQFSNRLDPYQTELPLAEFSPESLFWVTYAQAPMYETMLGLIEATCVLLVFFRRTRPIGALLTLAVMSNVAAMNVFFDISAKFNAFSLVVAALVLVVLFAPTYKRWLGSREDGSVPPTLGKRARRIGLGLKTVVLAFAMLLAFVPMITIVRPLASAGALYGKWLVEAVDGEVSSANEVTPLAPGSIVMFNKMNVLAVRSGEQFHFGRYVEQEGASNLELWMYRVTNADRRRLPPPGRLDERAQALAAYPLGYHLSGSYARVAGDQVALHVTGGGQPARVMLRKVPDAGTLP